jgi:hypothetical protein
VAAPSRCCRSFARKWSRHRSGRLQRSRLPVVVVAEAADREDLVVVAEAAHQEDLVAVVAARALEHQVRQHREAAGLCLQDNEDGDSNANANIQQICSGSFGSNGEYRS